MLVILFIIVVSYVLLIGSLIYGFDKVPLIQLQDLAPKTKFSIVIPFRNEASNLPILLSSISKLTYPKSKFEIIFVDDESGDLSAEIITRYIEKHKDFDVKIINNERISQSPKKDAITLAIKNSKNDWIVTTDADCVLPKFWLDTFDDLIQNQKPNMLIAPVTYTTIDSFFRRFQLLDFLSLQGATIGSFGIKKPILCNGANMAYKKSVFESAKGFEGNSNIASGDDIFLLEKFLKIDRNSVYYVKNTHSIVTTSAEENFTSLKSQRVRWASKTTRYKSAFAKLTGILVLLMNALLIGLPLLFALGVISLKPVIYTISIKFLIDFLLIFKASRFFNQEQYLSSYFFSFLLYPFFSVYIVFISMFKNYKWKDRTYKK
ncbi:glycosyltransferase family 2 protein [Psychroserpens sp. Hel_I_66]|uniref:glycosyltransferase family 2 protein n=1 Tax=Psychroserpens sp. Hel_I_66 TaxID=1250004 RepID=UPI000646DB27|nr:glycosyltransferase [Psychroserpens sp. Hel_I_66]